LCSIYISDDERDLTNETEKYFGGIHPHLGGHAESTLETATTDAMGKPIARHDEKFLFGKPDFVAVRYSTTETARDSQIQITVTLHRLE